MDYIRKGLQDVHMAVWVLLGIVSTALVGVVAMDSYEKSKRDSARATTATSSPAQAR